MKGERSPEKSRLLGGSGRDSESGDKPSTSGSLPIHSPAGVSPQNACQWVRKLSTIHWACLAALIVSAVFLSTLLPYRLYPAPCSASATDAYIYGSSAAAAMAHKGKRSKNHDHSTVIPGPSDSVYGPAAYFVKDYNKKRLVVARGDEDVSWLPVYFADVPYTVIQTRWTDMASNMLWDEFNGREAGVYLKYIVDSYDNLPDVVIFLHPHRFSWHMEDIVPLLKRFKWDNMNGFGFANLRHANMTNAVKAICVTPTQPAKALSTNLKFGVKPLPGAKLQDWKRLLSDFSQHTADAWATLFEDELGPVPDVLHAPCCAEFAVTRERIRLRPRAFYQRALNWFKWGDKDVYAKGAAFEGAWHVIFGEPHVIESIPECDLYEC